MDKLETIFHVKKHNKALNIVRYFPLGRFAYRLSASLRNVISQVIKPTQTRNSELIFDLSEVTISGLAGAERSIGQPFGRDPAEIMAVFSRPILKDLLRGRISEDQYLADSLAALEQPDALDEVKLLVRVTFTKKFQAWYD